MNQAEPKPFLVPRGTTLPPPLPGVRHVRVPLWGIVIADDELRDRAEHRFHWPMIVLALLVLPLLAVEFFYLQKLPEPQQTIANRFVWVVESLISFAFLIEFVMKITIAESRLEYIRRNWLDIIVILLPFLRALRLIRAARVARTSRVFRLRGVGMKFARYFLTIILGLNVTERLLERFGVHLGRGRKDPLKMTRYQLIDELKKLRRRVDAWEAWHEAQKQFLAEHGGAPLPEGPAPEDGPETAEDETPAEAPPSELAGRGEPAKMAAEGRSVRRPV